MRERYGNASGMWLHRREHDGSNFPKCVVIAGRKMWRLSELETWERRLRPRRDAGRHLQTKKDQKKNETAARRVNGKAAAKYCRVQWTPCSYA